MNHPPPGARADPRERPVPVQVLPQEAEDGEVPEAARDVPHGREALQVQHVRERVRVQAAAAAAQGGHAQHQGPQGEEARLEAEGEGSCGRGDLVVWDTLKSE